MAECLCLSLPNSLAKQLADKAGKDGVTRQFYIRELLRASLGKK